MSENKDTKDTPPVVTPPNYTCKDIRTKSNEYIRILIKQWGPHLFYNWRIEERGKKDEKEMVAVRKGFKSALLSAVYQKLWYPKTMIDRLGFGEMWYYDNKNHVYKPGAKDFFTMVTKRIWEDDFGQSVVTPTVYDLKSSTGLPRSDFKLKPNYIPQKDNILEFYIDEATKEWKIRTIENTPHLYVTSRYQASYNPDAKNPLFYKFMDDVFKFEDIPFLQEYCGSILWFESFLLACVLVGPTKGGKTEFTLIICEVLGGELSGNFKAIPIQTIKDTYERYRLYKLPANIINEFSTVTIKDSSALKAIITGAPISARTLRQESIDFIPYTKFLITTNTLPHVYDDNESWWNKWQTIVVSKQKFDKDNPDRRDHYHKLLTDTQEKRDAIFTWMVDGQLRLLNQGGNFTNRQSWEQVRRIWKSQQDTLGSFMYPGNGWVKFNDEKETPKIQALNHYLKYCKTLGLTAMSEQSFYKAMKRRYINVDNPVIRDVKPTIDGKQVYCYGSLEICEPEVEPPEHER